MTHPRVTIVMAIRNVAADLKTTLDNLSAQSFTDFEVLIADCNSVDDPSQYLKNRSFPIRHVVQSDTGIYDAWNKVLPLAQGEWVNFMGAGDHFATDQTLAQAVEVLDALPQETLMAYGHIDVLGESGKVLHSTGTPWPEQLDEIVGFGMYPHQATFQRRSSFLEHGYFDGNLAIAGDIDMLLRLSRIRAPIYFDLKVANFQFGGISNRPESRLKAVQERQMVLQRYLIEPKNRRLALWKASMASFLSNAVPKRLMHLIVDCYRILTGRKPRFR